MGTTIKLSNARFKELFPFYISDIDDKFFVSLNNHPNKRFVQKILPVIYSKLNKDESVEFQALENLTKAERIRLMLNLALKKIVAKTGTKNQPLFQNISLANDSTNENCYIQSWSESCLSSHEVNDEQINRRYNFLITINPESYLNRYLDGIQLSFYLDEDNKILSGGFSLNYENDNENIKFSQVVNKIYLRKLIHNFILNQLYPISLNNILELVEDYALVQTNKKSVRNQKKKHLQFAFHDVNKIKANWNDLIGIKYLQYTNLTDKQKQYYYDDLFFSILITTMIILSLYQELKIYFTSKTPEIILGLLNKKLESNSVLQEHPEQDFYQLSKHLRTEYFSKNDTIDVKKINIKKIKDTEELIEAIAKVKADYGFESFGYPIPIYEFLTKINGILINPDSVFKRRNYLKILYLLTISPELFGLDEDTSHFIAYGQLITVLNSNSFTSKSMPLFSEKIHKTNVEINHSFATFLNDQAVLIIQSQEDHHLYHDYYWGLIYARSIEWIKNDIEFDFDHDLNPKKNALFYQQKIQILENLIFDWHDDFYGLPQIKQIVYKIDKMANLKSSIRHLIQRISQKDQIYKKDNERRILVNAFLVAALIGFNNFFGMIYTVLSVNQPHLTIANIVVIAVSCFFSLLLIIIITIYFIKTFQQNRLLKNRG